MYWCDIRDNRIIVLDNQPTFTNFIIWCAHVHSIIEEPRSVIANLFPEEWLVIGDTADRQFPASITYDT